MSRKLITICLFVVLGKYAPAQTDGLPAYFEQLNNSLTENESITGLAISADGSELYFTKSTGVWGKTKLKNTIHFSEKKKGKWSAPTVAGFSGKFDDSDVSLSPNDRRLFFVFDRPAPDGDTSTNIWYVDRQQKGRWDEPYFLENVNSPQREYSPKTVANGDLYFASDRAGGLGQGDLYVSRRSESGFAQPENLGQAVNSPMGEWNLYLRPDAKVLLFEASQRPENASSYGDLFIAFFKNGRWSNAQHINEVATTGSELNPILDESDGLLYYISTGALESPSARIVAVPFQPIFDKYFSKD